MRRRPFSLVLLDEIEKAHPEVFNLLLQILEDGRLTDSYGRVVDFRNTILIMTSNVGTRQFTLHTNLGFAKSGDETHSYDKMRETVLNELKRAFNPELLNRIDEVTVFHPLTLAHMRQIVELMLHRLQEQLKERQMSHPGGRGGEGVPDSAGVRPELWRATAAAGHPAPRGRRAGGGGAPRPFRRRRGGADPKGEGAGLLFEARSPSRRPPSRLLKEPIFANMRGSIRLFGEPEKLPLRGQFFLGFSQS